MEHPLTGRPSEWDPRDPVDAADPIAAHARLRDTCPVAWSERWGGFWAVTRYDDLVAVTRDPEQFSSTKASVPAATMPSDPPRPPLEIDPPQHAEYRRLLNPYFLPRRIRAFEPQIARIATELVDEVLAEGTGDIVPLLAFPMPVRVLCEFLGLPSEDATRIKGWANEVIKHGISGDTAGHAAANAAMYGYVRDAVAARRTDPRDADTDLISGLLIGQVGGLALDDDQVAGILRLLIAAGHGTTTNAIGSALMHLATAPEDQDALRSDPSQIPHAVEEILRVWSPSRALGRVAVTDTVLGGRQIAAGDKLALLWTSANRDAEAFEDADVVRLGRRPNRHVAFGHGIHTCLGAPLARSELRVLLEVVLARTSAIRPAGEVRMADWPHIGPAALTLTFVP